MRPSGWVGWNDSINSAGIGKATGEALARRAIVVPHEFMATQQGIAPALQGVGCPVSWTGDW
jgi:hypothetical protein